MLPSPVLEGLGFQTCSHEACTTFDTCGPQRRSPAFQPDLSGGTAPCFRHSYASPQLQWLTSPLPCREFHSLGCTAFLLVTPSTRSEHVRGEHEDEDGSEHGHGREDESEHGSENDGEDGQARSADLAGALPGDATFLPRLPRRARRREAAMVGVRRTDGGSRPSFVGERPRTVGE